MLVKSKEKGKPHSLLVRLQTSVASLDTKKENSKNNKNISYALHMSPLGLHPKDSTSYSTHIFSVMSIAVLFTIAKK